ELLRAYLVASQDGAQPITGVIVIGAGTLNDIAKMAAFKADLPYAVVGTAPSMNGYTSSIAALLTNGVKTTQPCRAPVVCLADLDIMANSPYRMIASGLGDLISKPVSNADWRLSFRLLDAHYADNVMVLVDEAARLLEGIAPGLAARDTEAVGRLTASLCLSGLAMSVAGTSAPASGGEHLISHYIDMTHFAFGQSHDFHGCQVGVGTITTAALYEKLAALDPSTIDIEARIAAWPAWPDHRDRLVEHF
ncbi:MAG: iron-containing alcohol dehydrogenase, partial [Myxococcota bacterium]